MKLQVGGLPQVAGDIRHARKTRVHVNIPVEMEYDILILGEERNQPY